MSDKGIVIPTWAIPLVVSLFVGAISYGAAQANACLLYTSPSPRD